MGAMDIGGDQSVSYAKRQLLNSRKRSREVFKFGQNLDIVTDDASHRSKISSKILGEYSHVRELPAHLATKQPGVRKMSRPKALTEGVEQDSSQFTRLKLIEDVQRIVSNGDISSTVLTIRHPHQKVNGLNPQPTAQASQPSSSIIRRENYQPIRPEWHPPWKLLRVISGHLGWVRCVAVEPGNEWFCTGAGDRIIKIWDLASGTLKLSLTGHISTVRGLAVSPRHPYLFSCGEDRMVKCWDLEQNKVIRHYHGHLSGVYTLSLHPTLDVLVTGGRDASARVWDMRTRQCVHTLAGHRATVSNVKCQEADPQVITASLDKQVRLWDLAAGKTMGILTHHKQQVRALALHPKEFTFASGSSDNIKQWKCPEGAFMQNFEGHNAIVNTLAVNADGVLFSGADNGSMCFWDWKSGYKFQNMDTIVQPGSLESEAGVFASTFDRTGLRLITCNADKSIHVYGEDTEATELTYPMDWKPELRRRKY